VNAAKRTILFYLLLVGFSVYGCGPGQLLGPTLTPSPTITPTATLTPTQTSTPTPTIKPTGQINGTVFKTDGSPLKDCSITLNGETTTGLATMKTDSAGKYSFTDVIPGMYSISYTAMILNNMGGLVSITIGNVNKFEVKAGEVLQKDIHLI
jgi:hypothetical protein